MNLPSIKTSCAGLLASTLCSLALAAGDAGIKPPAAPVNPIVDKSPRCAPTAVNECRAACVTKKHDSTDKNEIAKKQNECRQDCIRGC